MRGLHKEIILFSYCLFSGLSLFQQALAYEKGAVSFRRDRPFQNLLNEDSRFTVDFGVRQHGRPDQHFKPGVFFALLHLPAGFSKSAICFSILALR